MKLFSHASPIFRVSNIKETAEYYRDVLGFTIGFEWGDPPSYIVMNREEVGLHLSQSPVLEPKSDFAVLYIFVHDADAVYEELKQKGANIIEHISDTDYHMREFMIEDLNGVKLMIGKGTSE
ncbi:MAG: hypothetical protein Tsb0034_03140 [Ekhidna sp.]